MKVYLINAHLKFKKNKLRESVDCFRGIMSPFKMSPLDLIFLLFVVNFTLKNDNLLNNGSKDSRLIREMNVM